MLAISRFCSSREHHVYLASGTGSQHTCHTSVGPGSPGCRSVVGVRTARRSQHHGVDHRDLELANRLLSGRSRDDDHEHRRRPTHRFADRMSIGSRPVPAETLGRLVSRGSGGFGLGIRDHCCQPHVIVRSAVARGRVRPHARRAVCRYVHPGCRRTDRDVVRSALHRRVGKAPLGGGGCCPDDPGERGFGVVASPSRARRCAAGDRRACVRVLSRQRDLVGHWSRAWSAGGEAGLLVGVESSASSDVGGRNAASTQYGMVGGRVAAVLAASP